MTTNVGPLAQLVTANSSSLSYLVGTPGDNNIVPLMSYYKFVYKRHTNFAMNTQKLYFDGTQPYLSGSENKFRCYITNVGNVLNGLYFRYKLPDIYSSDIHKFRWIPNFGTLLIKKAELIYNNQVLDVLTGEWLLISNELTENVKDNFNKITGNLSGFFNPKMDIPIITINNNRYANAYPIGNKVTGVSSIKGREIIVPLAFNFTKNPSLGVLLSKIGIANNFYLEITLESIENLYQVYSSDLNLFVSPAFYNELNPNDKISFDTFITNKQINAYVEANITFLNNNELTQLSITPQIDIIVDKMVMSTESVVNPGVDLANEIALQGVNTPIKEIIWTLKRDDYYRFNNLTNYTNSIVENNDKPIMSKAMIMYNRTIERVAENDANFFNIIQPHRHHTSIPKQGIYCYSYALFPEKSQPSGCADNSTIQTSLYVYTNKEDNVELNDKLTRLGGRVQPYSYKYRLNYYVRTINILRYINGTVEYAFRI